LCIRFLLYEKYENKLITKCSKGYKKGQNHTSFAPMSFNSKFIDSVGAASMLNVSQRYLYELVRQRKIPFYKPYGKLIFKQDELLEIVNSSKVQPITPDSENERQVNDYMLRGGNKNG
jgi:excisionase family DNA binding protein